MGGGQEEEVKGWAGLNPYLRVPVENGIWGLTDALLLF